MSTISETPNTNGTQHRRLLVIFAGGLSHIGIDIKQSVGESGAFEGQKQVRPDIEQIRAELEAGNYSPAEARQLLRVPSDRRRFSKTPLAAAFDTLRPEPTTEVELVYVSTDDRQLQVVFDILRLALEMAGESAFKIAPRSFENLNIGAFGTTEAQRILRARIQQADRTTEVFPLVAGGALNSAWDALEATISVAKNYAVIGNDGTLWRPGSPGVLTAINWYTRLGFSKAALQEYLDRAPANPQLEQLLTDRSSSLERVSHNQGTATDLAEWVRTDLRRRDYYEGLAFRSWVESEYHERFRQANTNITLVDFITATRDRSPNDYITLGKIVDKAGRLRRNSIYLKEPFRESTEFLIEAGKASVAARDSSHGTGSLPFESRRELLSLLPPRAVTRLPAESPLSGRIALMWAVGTRRFAPFTENLEKRDFSWLQTQFATHDDEGLSVDAFLLGSTDTAEATATRAKSDVDDLRDGKRRLPKGLSRHDSTFEHGVAPLDTALAREQANRWLGRLYEIDGIVVPAVGDRDQFVGLLEAAIDESNRRAVPVFVQTVGDALSDDPVAHFRSVARLAHADESIIGCIRQALRTLSFNTARRLAEIVYGPDSHIVDSIRRFEGTFLNLSKTVPVGDTLAQLEICTRALKDPSKLLSDPDKIRVFHVAVDCVDKGFSGGQEWTTAGHAGRAPAWLPKLHCVRNAFQVNHPPTNPQGGPVASPDEVATMALRSDNKLKAGQSVTLLELLEEAIRTIRRRGAPDPIRTAILDEWRSVVKQLGTSHTAARRALAAEAQIAANYSDD